MQWRNATLTAWSRTQQTASLSAAGGELHALTTGVVEGMVTKHLLQELQERFRDDTIETRLKQNREVTSNAKMKQRGET